MNVNKAVRRDNKIQRKPKKQKDVTRIAEEERKRKEKVRLEKLRREKEKLYGQETKNLA